MRAKRKHFAFQGVQIFPDKKYKEGKYLGYKNKPSFNRRKLLLELTKKIFFEILKGMQMLFDVIIPSLSMPFLIVFVFVLVVVFVFISGW